MAGKGSATPELVFGGKGKGSGPSIAGAGDVAGGVKAAIQSREGLKGDGVLPKNLSVTFDASSAKVSDGMKTVRSAPSVSVPVKPCPYSDVRVRDAVEGLKGDEVLPKNLPVTFGAALAEVSEDTKAVRGAPPVPVHVKPCPYSDVRVRDAAKREKSPNKIGARREFQSPWASSYSVTTNSNCFAPPPFQLRLDSLLVLDAPLAATQGPGDGGVNPCGDRPSPWARWLPGTAVMPPRDDAKEGWEWVRVDPEVIEEKEIGKEKGEGEKKAKVKVPVVVPPRRRDEEAKEEGMEQEKEKDGEKEHTGDVKELKERREETGEVKVAEEKGNEKVKMRRKTKVGRLDMHEAARAQTTELTRRVRALLCPGRLKRKRVAFIQGFSINTITNANSMRVRYEEKLMEKDLFEKKEKKEEKGKGKECEVPGTVQPQTYYKPSLFVFGARSEDGGDGSEVLFNGGLLEQVGKGEPLPEPEKIRFLHRLGGRLQTAILGGSETLAGWARQFLGDGIKEVDGYFTTKGGRVLNSQLPAGRLGLHGSQEVVLQGRLRGGGYSGGGKGVRGGGGNSVAAGDWTCGICNQTGCWNAKPTCYRCGAPRQPNQGSSGLASLGGWDMGGRYQGGVGSGMGSSRVVGPTGRDQSSVPGGNPTHRKGPQPGGKGRNKVGGDTGAGVGFGFGTGGGLMGGGGGGDNGNAFAWLGGGGGVGNPLPPGMVVSERDRYQVCVDLLKGLLKEGREMEDYVKFWEERLPAKPAPAPVKTPTEAQRAEVFAQLTKRQDGLLRRVKDGQGRVEAAREKVRQEEAALEELQRELKGVSDQVDAHRAENLRRAEEAKAPRVDEVGSDMDLEAGSSSGGEVGVNQVAGKRRKVVRQNRFLGNRASKEDLWQFFNVMPDSDKDWLKKRLLSETGTGGGCADRILVGEVVEQDEVELNARAPSTSTQEDVAETPCG